MRCLDNTHVGAGPRAPLQGPTTLKVEEPPLTEAVGEVVVAASAEFELTDSGWPYAPSCVWRWSAGSGPGART
ncbi:hypothetical protein [Ornithinimicrobium kibberense]|uniref:hypothetical protein n=1 Tax=Ornithinimicrobium kibberense TaxID=282060 RepID=UPI00360C54EF